MAKQDKESTLLSSRNYVGDRLYRDLKAFAIRSEPGTALKSERSLTDEYGICIGTVRRVLARLVEEELIYKVHGKGNFVASTGKRLKRKIIFADGWGHKYHPFFSRKLDGIIAEAEKLGFFLQVCSIHIRHEHERGTLLPTATAADVAGLIYPFYHPSFLHLIKDATPELPILLDQECLDADFDHCAGVSIDYYQAGRLAASYLHSRSVKHPLVLYCNFEMLAGFHSIWTDNTFPAVAATDLNELDQAKEAIAKDNYDGIFFGDDIISKAILAEPRNSQLYRISRKAIISYRNSDNKNSLGKIATLDVDGYEFGRLAMQVLCGLIQDTLPSGIRTLYQPKLNIP